MEDEVYVAYTALYELYIYNCNVIWTHKIVYYNFVVISNIYPPCIVSALARVYE